jgi:mitochondrial ATPase complex subunit ATP10
MQWIEPFRTNLANTSDRAEVIQINFSTGWFNKWLLRGFIQGLTIRNTPLEHRATTFLYFGDQERFRDTLRMHNLLSGYVFLLDGLGNVRFAGSGEAKSEEAERLIRLAKNLTPLLVEPSLSKQHTTRSSSSSLSSSSKRK